MNSLYKNADLKLIQTLKGHTDAVLGIAWRPKTGEGAVPATLASCSADMTVRIWQQSSSGYFVCKAVLDNPHTEAVRTCAWSPSGNLFATAFGNTTVTWECNNIWKCNKDNFKLVSTLQGHDKEVNYASWSECLRTRLATCSRDTSVRIWERVQDTSESVDYECEVLKYRKKEVKMIQWYPTMLALFSCCADNDITVRWCVLDDEDEDWIPAQTLDKDNKGHSSTVWALSFNPGGNRMVTASADLTLKVWGADVESWLNGDGYKYWKHRYTLLGYHDQPIYSVHWSCDGIIASGAADNAVCLFVSKDGEETEDVDDGEETEDVEDSEETEDVVDSGDSMDKVHRYELLLKKKNAHRKAIKSVQWSSGDKDNRFLATASEDKTVKIWKFESQ